MKFEFNTGRYYTPAGQRIRVEVERLSDFDSNGIADALVKFDDISRMVSGSFPTYLFDTDRPEDIQRSVMAAYDGGKYDPA